MASSKSKKEQTSSVLISQHNNTATTAQAQEVNQGVENWGGREGAQNKQLSSILQL